jgi:hypothetical protein
VDEEYHALVSVVSPAFPYLKKLYISIRNVSFLNDPGDEIIESHKLKLLGPIDEMVRKLGPQLQDCQIALPCSLYEALEYRAKSDGARIECGGCDSLRWRRIWHLFLWNKTNILKTTLDIGFGEEWNILLFGNPVVSH